MNDWVGQLLALAHELGREDRRLAILGEGNVSVRMEANRFAIKASGASLCTLAEEEVSICRLESIRGLVESGGPDDEAVEQALLEARVDATQRKPSIESMFHAWLLNLEGVQWVAHCHPMAVNQVLCSPQGREFAERRLFPDQVVYCGASSPWVPYVDPGLPLARAVRDATFEFQQRNGSIPPLILLQNHGIIAVGANVQSVLACVLMAEKAAEIFMGATAAGGPRFLPEAEVRRIAGRRDEAFRRAHLNLGRTAEEV